MLVSLLITARSLAASGATNGVDFARDIRPIISAKCYHCHGPDESSRKAKLRLDQFEDAVRDRKGSFAIKPGEPAGSELIKRVLSADPDEVMPPPKTGHSVSPEEVALLRRWIEQGAKYAGHWAFQKPDRPAVPEVPGGASLAPLDRFVRASLQEHGLSPSPEADRTALIRRVSLDLTGLPPTPDEVSVFLGDRSPGAYERLVDRLLESPHFGERWARVWLDIARYADSAGYGSDPLRLNIWPYRDWLIGAFNRNLSYDQFTIEQLAGDLLPEPTEEQRVATAFHRNTMTNTEGGTDDEEWRVAAVKDRANVTMQAWMGLTMGCAQCHTHKFDPISHREYYSFFAFFNQTSDRDLPDEFPTMALYNAREKRQRGVIEENIAELERTYREPNPAYDAQLAAWALKAANPTPWIPLKASFATSALTNGPALSVADEAVIAASGPVPEIDHYLVAVDLPAGATALRLDALAHDTLPHRGPGFGTNNGNFVLTDLRVFAMPADASPVSARFVRLRAAGSKRQLGVAEAQVFSGGRNVAPLGKPTQSSSAYLADAAKAIDGNTDGDVNGAHSTSLTEVQDDPWWELDLGAAMPVMEIALWDSSVGDLAKVTVQFLDADRRTVWEGRTPESVGVVVRLGPGAARELALREASADLSQDDFAAARAIDGETRARSGWAVGGGTGADRAWAAEFSEPLAAGQRALVQLSFNFGERHSLGRFRISATTTPQPVRILPLAVQTALAAAAGERTASHSKSLDDYFRPRSEALSPLWNRIQQRRRDLDAITGVPVPVMAELPADKRRNSHLLNKGNFLDPGEPVSPTVLAAFNPLPEGAPVNRLGVARWIVSADNPLTSRVAVNRFWAQLFGAGLVETEEDFGTQGALPSHPALLDWLAVEFMHPTPQVGEPAAKPWDMKRLLKLMVTSATYRQSARIAPAAAEKDPRNRWLSHFPRRRLDADMVRDQALSVAGLLSRKIGGPSVYPVQPDGLWRAAFNGQRTYDTSSGEDRFRRGLYTIWRRTVPYPSMATFDAPSRETCTFRRPPTNTPLQAYVTMNDPVFVEAAQALGRRLVREGGVTAADRIRFGYRLVTSRSLDEAQLARLEQLYESVRTDYAGRLDDARKLATQPLGPLPADADAIDAAAWTAVANVLLNLDAALNRG
jgi:hypothetical protein